MPHKELVVVESAVHAVLIAEHFIEERGEYHEDGYGEEVVAATNSVLVFDFGVGPATDAKVSEAEYEEHRELQLFLDVGVDQQNRRGVQNDLQEFRIAVNHRISAKRVHTINRYNYRSIENGDWMISSAIINSYRIDELSVFIGRIVENSYIAGFLLWTTYRVYLLCRHWNNVTASFQRPQHKFLGIIIEESLMGNCVKPNSKEYHLEES